MKKLTVREVLLEEIEKGGSKREIIKRARERLPDRSVTTFYIQYGRIMKAREVNGDDN